MKYQNSKFKHRELLEGEKYHVVRYEFEGRLYRTKIAAKDNNHARQQFFENFGNPTHDNLKIHTINFS